MNDDETFLGRWSRRKAKARAEAEPVAEPGSGQLRQAGIAPTDSSIDRDGAPRAAPGSSSMTSAPLAHRDDVHQAALAEKHAHDDKAHPDKPLPTLDSLRGLESEYSDFLKPEVAEDTRRAALKKLFADPHFSQMDRLDVYIDDYNQFEPMPAAVATSLAAYHRLSVFDHLASEQAKAGEANDEIAPGQLAASPGEPAPVESITASAPTPTQSDGLTAASTAAPTVAPTAAEGDSSPAATLNVHEADGERDRGNHKHPQ